MTAADEAEVAATLDGLQRLRTQLLDDTYSPAIRKLMGEAMRDDIEWLRARVLPKRSPSGTHVAPVLRLVRR